MNNSFYELFRVKAKAKITLNIIKVVTDKKRGRDQKLKNVQCNI